MSAQNPQPDSESPPARGAPASHQGPQRGAGASWEQDELLRKYGEAMLRIGQLEAQVANLKRQPPGTAPGGGQSAEAAPGVQPAGLVPLLERIEALERRLGVARGYRQAQPDAGSLTPSSTEDRPEARERDREIAQLRLQATNLANQLAKATAERQATKGSRARRRSRSRRDHSSGWKFWKRWRRR